MAIYKKKKFTSPKKVGGLGPPGPIGSAANKPKSQEERGSQAFS